MISGMVTTETRPAGSDVDLALAAKLFRGLGDRSRLAILAGLRDGERCVSELVAETGLAQPNVSNHLACLRDCGLVLARQEGRYVRYRLGDPRVALLLATAAEVVALGEVARGVAACPRYGEPAKDDR